MNTYQRELVWLLYVIQATDDSTCMILPVIGTYYEIVHNFSRSRFCARSHPTFLSQQLPQHHRWPAARSSPSWRCHRRRQLLPSLMTLLAPWCWCRPGRQAEDAGDARRGRRANAKDIVVVPRSPPVALAPSRSCPPSLPASLLTAASARTRRPSREACARVNSMARRPE